LLFSFVALHRGAQQWSAAKKEGVSIGTVIGAILDARKVVHVQLSLEPRMMVDRVVVATAVAIAKKVFRYDSLLKFIVFVNLKGAAVW